MRLTSHRRQNRAFVTPRIVNILVYVYIVGLLHILQIFTNHLGKCSYGAQWVLIGWMAPQNILVIGLTSWAVCNVKDELLPALFPSSRPVNMVIIVHGTHQLCRWKRDMLSLLTQWVYCAWQWLMTWKFALFVALWEESGYIIWRLLKLAYTPYMWSLSFFSQILICRVHPVPLCCIYIIIVCDQVCHLVIGFDHFMKFWTNFLHIGWTNMGQPVIKTWLMRDDKRLRHRPSGKPRPYDPWSRALPPYHHDLGHFQPQIPYRLNTVIIIHTHVDLTLVS